MTDGNEIETAVGYYEQAEQLGNPDAMHNLALINLANDYPNRPPNDIYCFNQFLRAAQLGHLESALHLVYYYADGIPNALPIVPVDAITWAKYIIFESNNAYADQMHSALKYALDSKPLLALLNYAVTADIGSELSAYNAAHISNELSAFTKKELHMEKYFLEQAVRKQYLPAHK